MRGNRGPKRTDIQALRAIAVLAVVIYHLWPDRLIGGFMGVDIFFVISGYLMTLTLMRDSESVVTSREKLRTSWYYLVNFYARRIKRLVPAASVTLLATLGAVLWIGNYTITLETAKQIFSSALFFQNWQLAADSVDYLAATNPPTAVQHFWSLSLEEQFYAAWPLVLLVILLCTVNLSILYKKTRTMGAIVPTLLLASGFFVYGYFMTKSDPSAAYFNTFARVWELLLGGAIAFLPALKNYDLKLMLPWVGLAMNVYAMFAWNGDNFPGWHALVPVLGTALIIYGGTDASKSKLSFSNLFKLKSIQWIGDISYSLYLWHWPLIILAPLMFGIYNDGSRGLLLKIWILITSFILAWLSYKFIEIPAQRVRLKKRYVYLIFIVIVCSIAGVASFTRNATESKVKSELNTLHTIVMANSGEGRCIGAKWQVQTKICSNGFGQINTRYIKLTGVDPYSTLVNGVTCGHFSPRDKGPESHKVYCAIGDVSSDYQIAVFGDSHTKHWINAFNDLGIRNGIKFIVIDSRTCGSYAIKTARCEKRLKFITNSKVLNKSKAIIVSILHQEGVTVSNRQGSVGVALNTLKSMTMTPVYLLEDIPPAPKIYGAECVIYKNRCKQSSSIALKKIKSITREIIAADIIEKRYVIPTDDMFCDKKYCYSSIGGLSVYNNNGQQTETVNSHLTASFSLSLSLPLEIRLKEYGVIPNN